MRTAASFLLVVGMLALADEPTYRGKPVGYWIQQLQQGEPPARTAAVKALRAFGPQTDGVLAALMEAFSDKEGDVRMEAISAFSDMGEAAAPAVGALANALHDTRADIRAKAAAVLGRLGPTAKSAASALSDALDDPDAAVQSAACAAIESLSLEAKDRAPIATRAARSKSPAARAWGLKQLAGLGAEAKDAEAVILDALADADPQIRKAAAEALARIGPSEQAIPALAKAIEDKDPSVVGAAVSALSLLSEKAVPPLLSLLEEDQANRWQLAAKALGQMGEKAKAVLPDLRKMLHDRDADFRRRAAVTLLSLGALGRPILDEAMKDSDEAVRKTVAQAVENRPRGVALAPLAWLARHQSKEGGWKAAGFSDECLGAKCEGAGNAEFDIGVTALALMAFLGAGYTPDSVDTGEVGPPCGMVVMKAIQWLLVKEDANGCFGDHSSKLMYNQALATMALAQACVVTKDEALRGPAQKAVNYLSAAQNPFRAWRYSPRCGDNDTSVTAWCVSALRWAQAAGLQVDPRILASARAYVDAVTDKNYGKVGYMSLEDAGVKVSVPGKNDAYAGHEATAAEGMVVRTYVDGDRTDPILDLTSKLLSGDLPTWDERAKTNDYYYWYWGTLAIFLHDGPGSSGEGRYWKGWGKAVSEALVKHENGRDTGCADGSWEPNDRWGFEGGRVYATAINALTLEVYYRYPNAFPKPK